MRGTTVVLEVVIYTLIMCSKNSVSLGELFTKMWINSSALAFCILGIPPENTCWIKKITRFTNIHKFLNQASADITVIISRVMGD